MCGIAGIVDPRGVDVTALVAMAGALSHRGPDGEGYALAGDGAMEVTSNAARLASARFSPAGLAHRRLTIIDLSDRSAQPMLDATGRLALVYNGELYNYVELRRELQGAGRSFRTSGDTEVVLQAWAEWGRGALHRFVGMWAFALLDLDRQEIVLCRDRFGIKPLFHAAHGGRLLFASEIKGLLAGMPTPDPNEDSVATFLVSAADTRAHTFFAGIERVPPGHLLTVPLADPHAARVTRYWSVPDGPGAGDPDAAERFAELFRTSIRLHTRSDVPVGTCLSGGLDSSAIVCTADDLRRHGELGSTYRHRAFGYVPPDASVSERPWMDTVIERTGVEFVEVRPSPERFTSVLDDVVRAQDEPFGSTSIAAQWFVFEAARQAGIKVMLDGQGADEVLGGYHGYLATVAAGMVADGRALAYARLALDHRRRLGTWPVPAAMAATLLPGPLRGLAVRLAEADNAPAASIPGVADTMYSGLRGAVDASDPLPTDMQALLRHQVAAALPSLLRYEDRNSMAHSIEARVPFLDHRLVEYAFALPADAKVRGADTKRLLRDAMKGTLPEPIRTRRDKLGFRADPDAAARFAREHRTSIIENRTPAEKEWFDRDAVARLVDAAQQHRSLDFPLWRVVGVKLWVRAHWGDDAGRRATAAPVMDAAATQERHATA
jgi:asparagine synthase (glutamine-hydrolysing)